MTSDHSREARGASSSNARQTADETVALLQATLDASDAGILVIDRDGHITLYNRRFLDLFGLTAEAFDSGGLPWLMEALAPQLQNPEVMVGGPLSGWTPAAGARQQLRFKDGRVLERLASPQEIGGAVAGVVVSYRDVTAAAQAIAALQEHRDLLEQAQGLARVGSWVAELGGDGRMSWSAETGRIFGLPPEQYPRTFGEVMNLVHEEDRQRLIDGGAAVLAGQPLDVEHRIVRPDGEIRWVHEKGQVIRDADGNPASIFGTIQDVTERRSMETRLHQLQKLEAIGRLAGGVAHDLNNALTAIIGFAEITYESLGPQHPARSGLDEIRRAAARAEAVTRELLAFSRRQLLRPTICSPAEIVDGIGRVLEPLVSSSIRLQCRVAADVPPIFCDRERLEQAVLKLAVNACDAMPLGGELTLAVARVEIGAAYARLHPPLTPGSYVELKVADTGAGIAPDAQAHLFEPFFTTKEIGKGTGLGLPMVYGTIKQNGGFIFAESALGQGTAFRLFFPPAAAKAPAAGPTSPRTAPTCVLVVEPEPSLQTFVSAALGRSAHRMVAAGSIDEALTVLADKNESIDVLLVDAEAPGIAGTELMAAVRKRHAQLPIILMTRYGAEQPDQAALPESVTILPKPFTPQELDAAIASRRRPR